MSAILEQLGLNQTFFAQIAIFAVLFLFLSNVYFKPFLKLFEIRHKKTVEDRESAERMMLQAQAKFDEYKKRLSDERHSAQKEIETVLAEAKREETNLLNQARTQAKQITQEAADSVHKQRDQLKKEIETEVENLAKNITEKLLSRKV